MEDLRLSNIPEYVQKVIEPFSHEILSNWKDDIKSIYIVGSAVTKDFDRALSDINTLIIVKEIKYPFFDFIAALGKRYGKKHVSAPLIMTCEYINRTLDVFPVEFMEMRTIHHLVYGEDVLQDIRINKADIRLQCERELKGRLENLCQGYIKAMGDRTILKEFFVRSISSYFPVFRGILFLYDQKVPVAKSDVLEALKTYCDMDIRAFSRVLDIKYRKESPSIEELKEIFKIQYQELDAITKKIDEFEVLRA